MTEELLSWLNQQGVSQPETVGKDHPLRPVADAWRYLEHNRTRTNYPCYRRQGLPVTSSLMESLVKQINLRASWRRHCVCRFPVRRRQGVNGCCRGRSRCAQDLPCR